MSELQNDEVEQEIEQPEMAEQEVEQQEVENQVDDNPESDLATDSDVEHEQKATEQDAVQKVINKKHFEAQQAKRELKEAQDRIAQFEAEQRKLLEQQVSDIPPMPDAFDDDYEAKMIARDEAIAKKAQYDAQQQALSRQQQIEQQNAQMKQQQELQAKVQTYAERTKSLGITQEEIQAAGNTVAQYGISDDLTMAILGDKDGPLLTKHLAANPAELSALSTMNPLEAALHIEQNIRPKVGQLRPKASKTPPPAKKLQPSIGAKESRYKNISGAKFE